MNHPKIYVAGHRGMVRSAIMCTLQENGNSKLVTQTHAKLDLTDHAAVRAIFDAEKIDQVFLATDKKVLNSDHE